jgi:hypothetical protein
LKIEHFWALGQHYGLKTPLLDWTMSPFVAAFFAFGKENTLDDVKWDEIEFEKIAEKNVEGIKEWAGDNNNNKYKDRVVWGVKYKEMRKELLKKLCSHAHIRERDAKDAKEREHYRRGEIDPIFEHFDPMSSEHERLIDQRGLFTKTKDGKDIKEIVAENWEDKYENPWLIKILIPSTGGIREDFLRGLNVMNINNMTLFREVDGAADFCNIGLNFKGYSIFPGQRV